MSRVLVDVDGVVCDFVSGYLDLVRKTGWPGSGSWGLPDITDWSFQKCLGLSNDCVREVEAMLFEPGVVRRLVSLDGSYQGIESLTRAGHEVVFVTSPWRGHPTWTHEREEWLRDRWPNVPIIHTQHKQYVSGDILVDDKPEHVEKWAGANPNGRGLCWDAPYNRYSDLVRVSGWPAVLLVADQMGQAA